MHISNGRASVIDCRGEIAGEGKLEETVRKYRNVSQILIDEGNDGRISITKGRPHEVLSATPLWSERVYLECNRRLVMYLLLVHLLLHRGCHDQSVNHDIFLLTDAECTIHGLSVFSGIPGRIKYDNPIRALKNKKEIYNRRMNYQKGTYRETREEVCRDSDREGEMGRDGDKDEITCKCNSLTACLCGEEADGRTHSSPVRPSTHFVPFRATVIILPVLFIFTLST